MSRTTFQSPSHRGVSFEPSRACRSHSRLCVSIPFSSGSLFREQPFSAQQWWDFERRVFDCTIFDLFLRGKKIPKIVQTPVITGIILIFIYPFQRACKPAPLLALRGVLKNRLILALHDCSLKKNITKSGNCQ